MKTLGQQPQRARRADGRLRELERSLFAQYGLTPTEYDVAVGDPALRIRVLEFGTDNGLPPVLLLHGITSVTAATAPLVPCLAAHRRVIAIDRPGHGLSDAAYLPPGSGARRHAVAVLRGVLRSLDITKVDIVGHSTGGQFALYLALNTPQQVGSVILLGAPGAAFTETRPPLRMKLLSTPLLGRALLSTPTSLASYRRNREALVGKTAMDNSPSQIVEIAYLASRRRRFAACAASFYSGFITARGTRPGVTIYPLELTALASPVLMIWGNQDAVLTPDEATTSIDAIPNGTLARIDGGHTPWLDDADSCIAAIEAFLAGA